MERSNYSFNAPTYFDFNQGEENENTEAYFETDHEKILPTEPIVINDDQTDNVLDNIYANISAITIDDSFSEGPNEPKTDPLAIEMPPPLRKSMSTGDLKLLQEIKLDDCTRQSKSRSSRLDKLAQPKSAINGEYVPTAEQMIKFYKTPDRFHTRHKNLKESFNKMIPSTIPQSPHLSTKNRHRATTTVLSREEREQQQVEEQKKFKIKANPVNYKALQGPVKPIAISKKPCTEVRPFNLTELHTKQIQAPPPTQQYEFHARPVPKATYETSNIDKIIQNRKQSLKHGSSDNLKIKLVKPASVEKPKPLKLTATEPMPFSFSTRDQQIPKRREQMISKIMEEERKARQFKAKPIPTFVCKSKRSSSLTSIASTATNKSEEPTNGAPIPFRAKTPTVLYQKPFEPKKSDRVLTEVSEFSLNTDRRVKEREEFDKKFKEKHEHIEWITEQRKKEALEEEKQEIAKIRKERVHIAQPIKKYSAIKIQPAFKVTVPISPAFKTTTRAKLQDKENK